MFKCHTGSKKNRTFELSGFKIDVTLDGNPVECCNFND